MYILILGVGNLLLSDEGLGVHVVQQLTENYQIPEDVSVIDGGTAGMELLSFFEKAEHVILIDAVNANQPIGSLVRLDNQQIPAFFSTKMSPHQIGLTDLLAVAQLTDSSPASLTLLGIQPASLELGMELSPPVNACLPQLLAAICAEVTRLGRVLTPLSSS